MAESCQPFNAWCPQKGHTYLNKAAAKSCRFVYACMTFLWISDIKGLTIFGKLFILDICGGPDYASVTFCYLCCVKSGVRKVSIPKDIIPKHKDL